jgi:hypothetical protein
VDRAQEEVQQRHRAEQQIIEQGLKEGVRDHLDNRW